MRFLHKKGVNFGARNLFESIGSVFPKVPVSTVQSLALTKSYCIPELVISILRFCQHLSGWPFPLFSLVSISSLFWENYIWILTCWWHFCLSRTSIWHWHSPEAWRRKKVSKAVLLLKAKENHKRLTDAKSLYLYWRKNWHFPGMLNLIFKFDKNIARIANAVQCHS